MKIVLSRKEMKSIANLVKEANSVFGESSPFIDDLKDQIVNRKALCLSFITGSFTLEVKEEFIIEFNELLTGLTIDCAPVLKSMISIAQNLIPVLNIYQKRFDAFTEKYSEVEEVESTIIEREVV